MSDDAKEFDFESHFDDTRKLVLFLSLFSAIIGSVLGAAGAATTLATICGILFVIGSYVKQEHSFLVAALGILFAISGSLVAAAHFARTPVTTLGYSMMIIGLWASFACLAPTDLLTTIRTLDTKVSFCMFGVVVLNLIGCCLLWGDNQNGGLVSPAVTAFLGSILFLFAVIYKQNTTLFTCVFWSVLAQYPVFVIAISNCDGLCEAGAYMIWISYWGYVIFITVFIINAFGNCVENRVDFSNKQFLTLVFALCLSLLGFILGRNEKAGDWATANGFFAILLLVLTFVFARSLELALVCISSALAIVATGASTFLAHINNEFSDVDNNREKAIGFSFVVAAILIALIVFHLTLDLVKGGVSRLLSTRINIISSVAMCTNLLGLSLWCASLNNGVGNSSLSITCLLTLMWFFYQVMIMGCTERKTSYWLLLFFLAYITTVLGGPAGASGDALGQIGAALVWMSHLSFVLIVIVRCPERPDTESPPIRDDNSNYHRFDDGSGLSAEESGDNSISYQQAYLPSSEAASDGRPEEAEEGEGGGGEEENV